VHGYHDASVAIGQAAEKKNKDGMISLIDPAIYKGDPRWPVKCDHCDYVFNLLDKDDFSQVFQDSVYRRTDTGEEHGLREWHRVEGAMWNAYWLADWQHGPDGLNLMVVCPGGHHWNIDGKASNCDSPCQVCGKPYHECGGRNGHGFVDSRPHQCWVRHGTPPGLTVDKNGITCGAGGGSIATPNWHGFLRNGFLA
jgi:hypothetical protein